MLNIEAAQTEATELTDRLAAELETLNAKAEIQASKLVSLTTDLEKARAETRIAREGNRQVAWPDRYPANTKC